MSGNNWEKNDFWLCIFTSSCLSDLAVSFRGLVTMLHKQLASWNLGWESDNTHLIWLTHVKSSRKLSDSNTNDLRSSLRSASTDHTASAGPQRQQDTDTHVTEITGIPDVHFSHHFPCRVPHISAKNRRILIKAIHMRTNHIFPGILLAGHSLTLKRGSEHLPAACFKAFVALFRPAAFLPPPCLCPAGQDAFNYIHLCSNRPTEK